MYLLLLLAVMHLQIWLWNFFCGFTFKMSAFMFFSIFFSGYCFQFLKDVFLFPTDLSFFLMPFFFFPPSFQTFSFNWWDTFTWASTFQHYSSWLQARSLLAVPFFFFLIKILFATQNTRQDKSKPREVEQCATTSSVEIALKTRKGLSIQQPSLLSLRQEMHKIQSKK